MINPTSLCTFFITSRWSSSCFLLLFIPLANIIRLKNEKRPMELPYSSLLRRRSLYLPNVFPSKIISLIFAVLHILPNYLSYVSLGLTTLAENISITCASVYLVYLVKVRRNFNEISRMKMLSMILCALGILIISATPITAKESSNSLTYAYLFSPKLESTRFYGNIIAFTATIFYAFHEIYYDRILSELNNSIHNAMKVLGVVGIISTALFWIAFPLLHFYEIEIFEIPCPKHVISILSVSILYLISTVTSLVGTIKISSMFSYLSSILILPLTATLEYWFTGYFPDARSSFGLLCIFISFLIFWRSDSLMNG